MTFLERYLRDGILTVLEELQYTLNQIRFEGTEISAQKASQNAGSLRCRANKLADLLESVCDCGRDER